MNILLVEDRMADAVLVKKLLERFAPAGTVPQIEHVESLAQAVDALEHKTFDCVLLDLGLPDGRGLTNLRRVRSIRPDAPVVILSGIEDERTAVAAVEAGASSYIVKRSFHDSDNIYAHVAAAAANQPANDRQEHPELEDAGRLRVDADGIILDWDERCAALLGWPNAQVKGRPLARLVAPSRRSEFEILFRRSGQAAPTKIKTKFLCAVGHTRLAELLPDGREERTGNQWWYLRDAEQARRAHQASQLLDAVLAATSDAILTQDLDGRIHSWNHGATNMLGFEAADVVGRNIEALVPGDCREQTRELLATIRQGRSAIELKTEFKHRDGHAIPIAATVMPLRDNIGGLIGACVVAHPSESMAQGRAA